MGRSMRSLKELLKTTKHIFFVKARHIVSVSVLLFGSCHLILFVSSTNSIQIVRRQCCPAQASKMHQTQNPDLRSCCKTPSTKNPATRSASHLSCWDLEQSQAKILCRDLKQQISFCVANQNALRLVKTSPSANVSAHSTCCSQSANCSQAKKMAPGRSSSQQNAKCKMSSSGQDRMQNMHIRC